jgi:Uma2 family endonuclease
MTTAYAPKIRGNLDYPTSDGKPMAETDVHRELMNDLIQTLDHRFADDPDVYVSGNLLLFYVPGDKRRHVSPDVLLVRGVPKGPRENYILWEEGRGPDLVIELTSRSTRDEDVETKFRLYQDVLRVSEYFLFDPRQEYLSPSMQGWRLGEDGRYIPVEAMDGRLPSTVAGLHLVRQGQQLRLYDPETGAVLPTPRERAAQAEAARRREAAARQEAEDTARRADAARRAAEAEADRLRREIEELRRKGNGA